MMPFGRRNPSPNPGTATMPRPAMPAINPAAPAAFALLVLALPGGARADQARTFDGWTMRCEDTGPVEKRTCLITAAATDPATKAPVAAVAIGFNEGSKQLRMGVQTAPQVERKAGVHIQVDGGGVYKAPYEGCTDQACVLRFTLPDDLLTQLKKGKTLTVAFTPVGTEKPVAYAMPLKGFSNAMKALTSGKKR